MNKKTVAINTFSLASNVGAMLQEYALYNYLKKLGFKPVVLKYICKRSYRSPYHYQLFNIHNYVHIFRNHMIFKWIRELKFIIFRLRMKHSARFKNTTKRKFIYDYLICGSDQILNEEITGPNQFIFINGGDIIQTKAKKIMYAGSFGRTEIKDSNVEYYKNHFNKLDYISFREDTYVKIVSDLCNKQVVHTCDPVFLLEKDFWLKRIKKKRPFKEKYIFAYYVDNEILKPIIEYAEKHDTKILYVWPINKCKIPKNKRFVWVHDDPIAFINYVYYAEYIFTTSFHGSVFSLIFDKHLYCPITEDKIFIRLRNLLVYWPDYRFDIINDKPVDYKFYEKTKDMIDLSKSFLNKALE